LKEDGGTVRHEVIGRADVQDNIIESAAYWTLGGKGAGCQKNELQDGNETSVPRQVPVGFQIVHTISFGLGFSLVPSFLGFCPKSKSVELLNNYGCTARQKVASDSLSSL
jgi:hypothetical protein